MLFLFHCAGDIMPVSLYAGFVVVYRFLCAGLMICRFCNYIVCRYDSVPGKMFYNGVPGKYFYTGSIAPVL